MYQRNDEPGKRNMIRRCRKEISALNLSMNPNKQKSDNERKFSVRLTGFFFIIFALFAILIIRLALLQFVDGPTLKQKETSLGYRTTAIAPIRGIIYDASNHKIAYSTSTQSLYFNVNKNYKNKENMAEAKKLAEKLAERFKSNTKTGEEQSVEDIVKRMDLNANVNPVFVPRLIKTDLSSKEVAYFLEHKSEYKDLEIIEDSVRNYDQDTVAVQTIGYLKKFRGVRESYNYYKELYENRNSRHEELRYLYYEDVGVDGLEFMYQEELRGKNGLKKFPVNVAGRIMGPMELTKPERGNNLHLTIHKSIQMKTEAAIMQTLQKIRNSSNPVEQAPNARTGYAVAMEVKTGNIVAMASMPDYDSNVWKNGSISVEDYEKNKSFMNNGTIKAAYGPYEEKEMNKHPNSIVYLGSTIKPLSVLIGLQEKLFSVYDDYPDIGYAEIGLEKRKIRNANNKSHGRIDAAKALEFSSNAFMIDLIGKRLYSRTDVNGLKTWDKYMEMFGLGVKTGSGLPGEIAGLKDYMSEAVRASAQSALAYASFGQQGKYTTLQLAQYAAALASHGKRMKPQFVSKITDPDGKVVKEFKPEMLNEAKFDKAYWDLIELGMSRVKVQGFEGFNYDYYRKTGTSEQEVAKGIRVENGVFIAYAPAQNPTLAVAVVVPEGNYGAYSAAPIARAIFDAYDEAVGLMGTPRKTSTNQQFKN